MVSELDAQRAKLGFQIANTDAEDQPPAGEDVQTGQLLGQHQRVALRQDDHPGTEPQPTTDRGGEGQRDDGVQDGLAWFHG